MAIRNLLLGGIDWEDDATSTLNGGINDSVTTITVVSTTGFKTAGEMKIDTEVISYTGVTATDFTGCTRGAFNTTAAAHLTGVTVYEKEVIESGDLNDTFDALVEKVQNLSCFWLNSSLYDVYDDFDSETTGAFTTNTNWTISGAAEIVVSNAANGGSTGKELKLSAVTSGSGAVTVTAISKLLVDDRHTHIALFHTKVSDSVSPQTISLQVSYDGGSTYYVVSSAGIDNNLNISPSIKTDFLAVAKGSNVYDLYAGGYLLVSDVTIVTPQVAIKAYMPSDASGGSVVYIDDVRQSKTDL